MARTVVISKDRYERMKEIPEILSDPKLLKDIREGIADIRRGRTASLDKYLKLKK